jgi:large subunit ribosomal protein L31e
VCGRRWTSGTWRTSAFLDRQYNRHSLTFVNYPRPNRCRSHALLSSLGFRLSTRLACLVFGDRARLCFTDSQTPKQRSALHDVVTREYTINIHKRTHDLGFKKSEWRGSCRIVITPRRHRCISGTSLFVPPLWRTTHLIRQYPEHVADQTEAPTAIKAVIKFAQSTLGVNDVRISPGLNQAIWSRGIKSPPKRVRVRLERKRNDDEGAKEKLYVLASVVEGVTSFKVGLGFISGLCTISAE